MGALWRKQFRRTAEEAVHRLSMKNKTTGMAKRCECDPCMERDLLAKAGWNIVTVCPCSECDPAQPVLGDQTDGAFHCDAPFRPVVALDFGGSLWPGACRMAKVGFTLDAVSHLLPARAETGGYNAKIYVTPPCGPTVLVGEYGEEYPAAGGWIGDGSTFCNSDGVPAESPVNLVKIDPPYVFSDAGVYAVSLKVSATNGMGVPEESYSRRIGMLVIDRVAGGGTDGAVTHGSVFVVPDYYDFGGCQEDAEYTHGEETIDTIGEVVVLKGPFSTKAEAERVMADFEELIKAYADSCACPAPLASWYDCGMTDRDFPYYPFDADSELLDAMGGCTGGTAPGGPGPIVDRLLEWSIYSWGDYSHYTVGLSGDSGTMVIPACSGRNFDWGIIATGENGGWSIHLDWTPIAPAPNCKFCADPDDPDAPDGCIYAMQDYDDIPANSAEYEELYGGE